MSLCLREFNTHKYALCPHTISDDLNTAVATRNVSCPLWSCANRSNAAFSLELSSCLRNSTFFIQPKKSIPCLQQPARSPLLELLVLHNFSKIRFNIMNQSTRRLLQFLFPDYNFIVFFISPMPQSSCPHAF